MDILIFSTLHKGMVVAPRKRTFDPTTTLDTAMELFWARGYHNCSIADVVAASGVARYGVYQEFGDKNALYRAALQRYRELATANLKTQLKTPEGGLAEIKEYFMGLATKREAGDQRGCMACQAAVDRGQDDPQVAEIVDHVMEDMRTVFGQAVDTGMNRGEMRDVSKEALVEFLVGLQRSIGIMARTPTPNRDIDRYINASLTLLNR